MRHGASIRQYGASWIALLNISGHNRYEICQKHGLTFTTSSIAFNNIEEAEEWIDANQLGRRNLTVDAFRYLIGKQYNKDKTETPNPDGVNKRVGGNFYHQPKTAETIAKKYGVTEKTVRSDGKCERLN
jgi:hypothetical protein